MALKITYTVAQFTEIYLEMKKKLVKTLLKLSCEVALSACIIISFAKPVSAKSIVESTEANPYKIAAIGDSITYPVSYASVIGSNPLFTVENYGIPGSQVAQGVNNSFVDRTRFLKTNADLITIMGGTNDYCAPGIMARSLGTIDSTDETTFCGAYNAMIRNLKINNSNAKIVLITPIKGKGGATELINIYGLKLEDYANAVRQIAAYNNVPCIDLFHNQECCFTENDKHTLLGDAIHPNLDGHTLIAGEILKALSQFSL